MKRKSLILLVLTAITFYATITTATMYSNNLIRYVSKLKNKIPDSYTAPTESQIDILRKAVWHTLNDEFAGATLQANLVGYNFRAFTHTNNRIYYILEPKNPKYRPWGTYIFYLGDDVINYAIEIPHPVSDKNTSDAGIELFIDSGVRAFLLSGSRRNKFDVAYNEDTNAFQGVHEEVANSSTEIIQLHSFNIPKYPQIVLTGGTPVAAQEMDKYVEQLIKSFDVGIYDGSQYTKLGSTDNLQALYTNSINKYFMCVFMNRRTAYSKSLRNKVVDLLETAITETTSSETTT